MPKTDPPKVLDFTVPPRNGEDVECEDRLVFHKITCLHLGIEVDEDEEKEEVRPRDLPVEVQALVADFKHEVGIPVRCYVIKHIKKK